MRYTWMALPAGAKRWALVLVEDDAVWTPDWYPPRARRAPGLESSNFSDILHAELYLNQGFVGNLTEHQRKLLDQVAAETYAELGL